MKKFVLAGFVALPLAAGGTSAAERLSDAQMDQVTAGDLPSCGGASMCAGTLMMATSTTVTTTNSSGVSMTTTTHTITTTALGSGTGGTGGTGETGGTGTTGGTGGTMGPVPVFPLTITGLQSNIIVTAPLGITRS